jgi:uncharacterized membrane protein YfcA
MVSRVLAASGGFILAVLWMDLMFDRQAMARSASGSLPEDVLASLAAYYRRVTTDAHPMSRLIAAVMVVTIAGSAYRLLRGDHPAWAHVAALVLCTAPIALAAVRIVPSAVRLGRRADSQEEQSRLAREIARAHVLCFLAISVFVLIQICTG